MKRRDFLAGIGTAVAAGESAMAMPALTPALVQRRGDICRVAFQEKKGRRLARQIVTFAHPFPAGVVWPDTRLKIGDHDGQMDVSATYEDGSVRHALLAAVVPNLKAGETAPAMIRIAPPVLAAAAVAPPVLSCDVVVTVTPEGGQPVAVDVGAAFRAGPVDRWRSGPLVSEGRVRIPVNSLAEDFEVVCDLACFSDVTPKRLDINFCREKSKIVVQPANVPKAPDIAYAVSVADGGKAVHRVSVPRHARAQIWHYAIGESRVHVVFDIHALRASGAVIHDPSLGVDQRTLDRLVIRPDQPLTPSKYGTITVFRDLTLYMGQTGGRPDIGPETTAVACWLISQQAGIAEYCLWQADGASAIPWHWRDAGSGSYVFVSDYPDVWMWYGIAHPGTHGPDVDTTGGGWAIDYSHQPDCSFVPWLLTGRRKFLDDLLAQATQSVNWFNPYYRKEDKGYICQFPDAPYQQQVRGQAWSLRQVAQAAAFAPDAERLKARLKTVAETNLAGLLAVSNTIPEGELRYWITARPATWEQDYMATTLAAADALGFADAWPVMRNMMGFLAGIMLSPDFYPKDCCAYVLPITVKTQTWREARDAFVAEAKANPKGSASGLGVSWAGNTFRPYYAARRGTLSYAARKGDVRAQKALKWFLANIGDGPSAGATDAAMRADPTFAIG